jgi:hypothetical protein
LGTYVMSFFKSLYRQGSIYYLDLQLKLVINGIVGIRLPLILILSAFLIGIAFILDVITVFVFITCKTSLFPELTTVSEGQLQQLFFVTEEQKRIYFKMQSHDQLKYYREVANMLGGYVPPKPIREWEYWSPFPPLSEIYEEEGLLPVLFEGSIRSLMISDAFRYIIGYLWEDEETHLEDVVVEKELEALVAQLRKLEEGVDDEDFVDEFSEIYNEALTLRRFTLPMAEFYMVLFGTVFFWLAEEYLFVPEYVVWDKASDICDGVEILLHHMPRKK